MNAYKDMLDIVVSPITCVSMNHQNQLEQMANGVMFATVVTSSITISHVLIEVRFHILVFVGVSAHPCM
jgi:hypothetical protein